MEQRRWRGAHSLVHMRPQTLEARSSYRTHCRTLWILPGYCRWAEQGQGRDTSLSLPWPKGLSPWPPHLARFSVTLRKASCFLARFLAAASLAIFRPSRSLRPGSKICKAAGIWVVCAGPTTKPGSPLLGRATDVGPSIFPLAAMFLQPTATSPVFPPMSLL
jgi:hypothetical protein